MISYTKNDLNKDFLKKNEKMFKSRKGAGYWVWKPKIVQITLEKMNDGDLLLYADTGCELRH